MQFLLFLFKARSFYGVWWRGSAGWSVSGSEHVVVFSFVMPWVLWTSWGRYCMEGNQDSDSGPANRLDVQVLENSCYHRASQGYTSVQGPQRRLNMHAKSSLISQVCFRSNIHLFFHWNPYQFGDSFWHRESLNSPSVNGMCNSFTQQRVLVMCLCWLWWTFHVFC